MKIEGTELMKEILDKQWEIIGEKIRFRDIPEDGEVQDGKKKRMWYEKYKMTEDEEERWREMALAMLNKEKLDEETKRKAMMWMELRYGMVRSIKKEGTLF